MSGLDVLAAELIDALIPRLVDALESRANLMPAPPRPDLPALLTEKQYSEHYSIPARTLQGRRLSGKSSPQYVRLGRRILYLNSPPTNAP
jgi:hypothetical protein